TSPATDIQAVLARSGAQRRREYQYRFAQSFIFGLPVMLLQGFGYSLGGPESGRWIGLLQALLAGWVIYVGAAGMLFEGIILLARWLITPDLIISVAATGAYLLSLFAWATLMMRGSPWPLHPLFHWSVIVVAAWALLQWFRLSGR